GPREEARHDPLRDVGHEVGRRGPVFERGRECAFLRIEERQVEPKHLAGKGSPLDELGRPPPALRPAGDDRGGRREAFHQIFSMLTRNALNSGVRELASPTNGVSALASQLAPLVGSRSAAMPTNPQWIAMPMW